MVQTKHLEIELKFRLHNAQETLDFLRKNARHIKDSFQKDSYFMPSNKNFLDENPVTKWLRIRESDTGNSITYKHWSVQHGVSQDHCDEFEIQIDSPQDAKKMFDALDILPLITVDKKRKVFDYQHIKISIDEVDELWRFIELEIKGDFPDIESARAHLYHIAAEIWCQLEDQDKKWYPYVLLEKKGLI